MYVFSISFSKHLAHLEYNYSQKYIFIPQLFIQTQCTPLVNSTPWGQKRILPHPPTPTKSKLAILHGISMLLHTPPFYLLFIFLDIWFRHWQNNRFVLISAEWVWWFARESPYLQKQTFHLFFNFIKHAQNASVQIKQGPELLRVKSHDTVTWYDFTNLFPVPFPSSSSPVCLVCSCDFCTALSLCGWVGTSLVALASASSLSFLPECRSHSHSMVLCGHIYILWGRFIVLASLFLSNSPCWKIWGFSVLVFT